MMHKAAANGAKGFFKAMKPTMKRFFRTIFPAGSARIFRLCKAKSSGAGLISTTIFSTKKCGFRLRLRDSAVGFCGAENIRSEKWLPILYTRACARGNRRSPPPAAVSWWQNSSPGTGSRFSCWLSVFPDDDHQAVKLLARSRHTPVSRAMASVLFGFRPLSPGYGRLFLGLH